LISVALVLSALAIQLGGTLIGVGAKILQPEVSKLISKQDMNKISESIDIKKVREAVLVASNRVRLKSK